MVDLKYIGHSAFEIRNNEKSILIDPLVSSNHKYDWEKLDITDIFLTHAHRDHVGEAIEIAKKKNATITAIFELANYCEEQGCKVNGVNFGGWLNYEWGKAIFLPAFHSSSLPDGRYGGSAASILLDIDNVKIYHAGDTCLNAEMKLVKELYRPGIALLPVGGHYTMDVEHAAVAAEWIGAPTVIPMHYNTFPAIEADLERFARLVQRNNLNTVVLNPNEI